MQNMIREFTKGNLCWLILDTNFAYERDQNITERNLQKILTIFDEKMIQYDNQERMVEKDFLLMGISVKKREVKECKIVIKLTEEVIENLGIIFNTMSIFCYIIEDNKEFNDAIELHNQIQRNGNDHTMMLGKDGLQMFIYIDYYFKRIRLAAKEGMNNSIREFFSLNHIK